MVLIALYIAYFCVCVFLVASVARVIWWARMPLHVRWELYPVAHEPGRAHYGGSYLEESDWWKKPRRTSLYGELKVMVPEILLLLGLKEHNPRLWLRSFPFHFGIYLAIGCCVLMAGNGVLMQVFPSSLEGVAGALLYYAIVALGYAGVGLGLLGALGLLHIRATDPALKDITSGSDIFNLLFFVVTFAVVLFYMIVVDRDLARSMALMQSLITFSQPDLSITILDDAMCAGAVILVSLLVAYIPLTHMSHYIAKYFAYHAIRWNDAPNLRGGIQEAVINKQLNYPVSWSGPHIQGGGRKTWADLSTEEMKK